MAATKYTIQAGALLGFNGQDENVLQHRLLSPRLNSGSLKQMSPELQNKLIDAIWREKRNEVEALLAAGADVNATGSKGWTPLMQAAETENSAIVQLLLEKGAEVNRPGDQGHTPLHIAVDISTDGTIQTGGHPGDEPTEIIEVLLARGASPFVRDVKGETALDWALRYNSQKVADILRAWQQRSRSQQETMPNRGPAEPRADSNARSGPPR